MAVLSNRFDKLYSSFLDVRIRKSQHPRIRTAVESVSGTPNLGRRPTSNRVAMTTPVLEELRPHPGVQR
jgi:hypothetical protein